MQKKIAKYFLYLPILLLPSLAFGQISGNVFEGSGRTVQDNKLAKLGKNLSNVQIKAYSLAESGKYELFTQTQSDAKSYYFLNIPEGKLVKLVFDDGTKKLQSNALTPAVSFVKSPATDINWGVYQPTQYVSPKPYLVSPVYINGKGNDSLSALTALSFEDTSVVSLATSKQVGALWAVAFNKGTQQLYSAALAKRHVGYGPLGTGGIYRTNWQTRTTTNWLDLKTLGIPTGDDNHEGLKAAIDSSNIDGKFMADVGKLSLGGMDISEDAQTLYVMNLFNRTLYGIKLPADTAALPTAADVTSFKVPTSGCSGGNGRPFAVKVYGDKVYVGMVCDAQDSQSTHDLTASVYALDPATQKFSEVFTMPLDYARGKAVIGLDVQSWYPWTDDFSKALHRNFPSTAARPQPILSSIVFDGQGAMLLGFMDRFGHQSGVGQPDPTGKASYSGVAAGDVLRVYPRKPGNKNVKFRLEDNAAAGDLSTEGKDNLQGPKGGEFFFQDGFTFKDEKRNGRIVHEETGAGGLLILPGTEEILITAHEPTATFNSGGIKSFFNEDGKTNRGWLLYGNAQMGTFGKANGVGGLALISDLPPIAIGNRIWSDVNGDGVQDPDEPAISKVAVDLWQRDVKLGQTTTDADGTYLFSEENVNGSIKPGTDYAVKVKLQGQVLKPTFNKSTTDKEVDNDGVEMDGFAVANFKTRKAGENIHDIDFGFLPINPQAEKTSTSEDGNLVVYPNPVVGKLVVDVKSTAKSGTVSMVDVKGTTIHHAALKRKSGGFKTTLDLTDLPAGSYIIGIDEQGKARNTAVIIKQ